MRRLTIRHKQKKPKAKMFTRKKSIVFFVFLIVCLAILMVSLVILDNLTIAVRRETVQVPSMSDALEGYTILHLTDLHGQMFGSGHDTLFRALSGRSYDIVLITGDLVDTAGNEAQENNTLALVRRFTALKKPVYYVRGNHDPALTTTDETGETVMTPFYERLEQEGAVLVDAPVKLTRQDAAIWLYPYEMLNLTRQQAQVALDALEGELTLTEALSKARYAALLNAFDERGPTDLTIAMTHYPLTPTRVQDFIERIPEGSEVLSSVAIVLSGHYHGGQMRVPFLGAVYVPADTLGMNGFFPDNRYVRGLSQLEDTVWQNISGGLGSTGIGSTSLFKFRLFSTPEVSLITFTK